MSAQEQPTLWQLPLPAPSVPHVSLARHAPLTSVVAAELARPKSGSRRETVLLCIASSENGLTDAELVITTGLPINVITARRNELVKFGWVENSGEQRKVRPSHLGVGHAPGIVWKLSARGAREWRETA